MGALTVRHSIPSEAAKQNYLIEAAIIKFEAHITTKGLFSVHKKLTPHPTNPVPILGTPRCPLTYHTLRRTDEQHPALDKYHLQARYRENNTFINHIKLKPSRSSLVSTHRHKYSNTLPPVLIFGTDPQLKIITTSLTHSLTPPHPIRPTTITIPSPSSQTIKTQTPNLAPTKTPQQNVHPTPLAHNPCLLPQPPLLHRPPHRNYPRDGLHRDQHDQRERNTERYDR